MSEQHDLHDDERIDDGRRQLALGIAAAAGLLASQKAAAASNKKLVVVFQRFAADGLMELIPVGDPLFNTLRPASCWPNGGLATNKPYWKLHPRFGDNVNGLGSVYSQIWQKGNLALIPATCITQDTRSHFTSQALLEAGNGSGTDVGFCSRALTSDRGADDPILRGVCLSDYVPDLARGDYGFLSIADPASYNLTSRHFGIDKPIRSTYAGQGGISNVAEKTAAAIDQVRTQVAGVPLQFASDDFGLGFRKAAQFLLANVGTQIVTMDIGGWDHHANVQDNMNARITSLNSALVQFKNALGTMWTDTTVVFVTEFGRTLQSNSTNGTDHGWGSLMMVAGGSVKGGIYGQWQGLAAGQAINAVPALNDYRHAFAEVFAMGLDILDVDYIFPGFNPVFHGFL